MKTILQNDNERFVPTLERWVELYSQWFKLLVRALGMYASKSDCEEAVQEAFLKVMGFSPNLMLRKPLKPKTLKAWYGFLYWHARGILSHMQSEAARFELKCGGSLHVDQPRWAARENASHHLQGRGGCLREVA